MSKDGQDTQAAIEKLAQRLYWNMNRLDPDPEAIPWAELNEDDKLFYLALVEDLAGFGDLVQIARGLGSGGGSRSW
jgi:hypothetical protein